MEWLEVHIDTNHAGLEPLEIFLSANGVDGVVIDDEQDFQSFLEKQPPVLGLCGRDLEASMKGKSRITFYLPADGDGFDQLAHLRTALQGFKDAHAGKYGTLLMTLENLKDADWENNWKQYYKPMEIGERLLVIPEWEQENVKGQAKYAGKVPLILEPGLTFGTGSHATTRLCLTALEEAVHGGETVLDLGCGSGILSIAALRLGAASAKAVDIDDKCLTVAYENAALNGIGRTATPFWWGCSLQRRPPGNSGRRLRCGGCQHCGGRHHRACPHGAAVPEARRAVPLLRHHRHPGRGGGGRPPSKRLGNRNYPVR